MTNERARIAVRRLAGVVAVATVYWLPAGVAHADETNTGSHNGPRIGLVNLGQVDDPAEDVLEHFRLIGDEQTTENGAS
ncbi:hypothetical protein [Streptomyces chromofuscus]|uniref:Secreted protein n=1 Tax=Streptomyces chromofuscus TaxID=42881 RepID=A0A7M2TFC3_STRCW|nr:hypothetical protein [Streptomyces chromofuscus]QOV45991.1 hypothetical protein IPT68_08810 [Streptomyces chromofuscus]GGT11891.1 hypothetical protein GCM10010254_35680 [Streptomyces chromofuscus]